LAQRNAVSAALVVTVWTVAGPAAARGLRAGEHPDRQEAVTVMLANALGAEETMLANVCRHRFGPPTVDRFKTVSHGVQPHVAEAFRRGFAGLG
jgi:hypothetical protein